MQIDRIGGVHCIVGEGPVWDIEEQVLYFVDLFGRNIFRHEPGKNAIDSWEMPERVGSIALCRSGGALVALANGIFRFDFASGSLTAIGNPEAGRLHSQWNDGKVDPAGRFIVGTVATDGRSRDCGVYQVDGDMRIKLLDEGFGVGNGPCWSPDGATFYYADSSIYSIFAYDYDPQSGALSNKRLFANTEALGGIPDGATVDSQGRLWSAICRGGIVAVFDPAGRLIDRIEMPTPMVSSVMFGGPDLQTLYVTSIDPPAFGRPAAEGGGSLFTISGLGVRGCAERRFADFERSPS